MLASVFAKKNQKTPILIQAKRIARYCLLERFVSTAYFSLVRSYFHRQPAQTINAICFRLLGTGFDFCPSFLYFQIKVKPLQWFLFLSSFFLCSCCYYYCCLVSLYFLVLAFLFCNHTLSPNTNFRFNALLLQLVVLSLCFFFYFTVGCLRFVSHSYSSCSSKNNNDVYRYWILPMAKVAPATQEFLSKKHKSIHTGMSKKHQQQQNKVMWVKTASHQE